MNPTIANAHRHASELLKKLNIVRIPVAVPRLARSLGITIEYVPLDDELSGMAFTKDGEKLIWVNSLHHPNRQRFTIGHEIGHHELHASQLLNEVHVDKGILRRDAVSATGAVDIEIEANAFASELLMPSEAISEALDEDFDLDDSEKIKQLASRFKVSTAAMQYRLMRL